MVRKILVVDDSEVVLGVTKAILEDAGYEVLTNRRATGSVAMILQTKPDLVLLDVNMPSLRGDMIARMSVATNNSIGTVVVLHSSLPEDELKRLAAESSAHGYIKKTENVHMFIRRVRFFLDQAPTSAQRSLQAQPAVDSEADPSSRKREKRLSVLLVGGDMTELSHLRHHIQDLGYEPSFALSAQQATNKIRSASPDVIVVGDGLGDLTKFLSGLAKDSRQRVLVVCDESKMDSLPSDVRTILRPVSRISLGAALSLLNSAASTGS